MPASSKPRKPMRKPPRSGGALLDRFCAGLRRLRSDEKQHLALGALTRLERLSKGGTRNDWDWVVDCINMGKAIARHAQYTDDARQTLSDAEDALAAVRDRVKAGKPLAFKASELEAVRAGVEVSLGLHEVCTKAEFDDAYDWLVKKIGTVKNESMIM